MDKSQFFAVVAAVLCCANAIYIADVGEQTNRITAGSAASQGQFSYAISIQELPSAPNTVATHRCGGAMITLQRALTAATCTYNVNSTGYILPINVTLYQVFAGSVLLDQATPERIREIANYTMHNEHLPYPSLLNDIAVVTLVSPFVNGTVIPIPYAIDNFIPDDFALCTVAGWGASDATTASNNQLRFANKYIYNHDRCTTVYSLLAGSPNIHVNMMCAASYDVLSVGCTGDIGNPLVCDGQLTGILSLSRQCVADAYPEIYTRLSNYTTWIRANTGGASTFKPELGFIALIAVICAKMFS